MSSGTEPQGSHQKTLTLQLWNRSPPCLPRSPFPSSELLPPWPKRLACIQAPHAQPLAAEPAF